MFVQKFKVNGSKTRRLARLIYDANEMMKDPEFYHKIRIKGSFDMSTASSAHIANEMQRQFPNLVCEVHVYSKKWSRALAFFSPRYPNRININLAKLNRSDGSIGATMVHEWVHLVDAHDEQERYGHGDNSRAGKENTAPYWIDNLAEALFNGKRPDFNNIESANIVVKRSVWSKVKRFFRRIF